MSWLTDLMTFCFFWWNLPYLKGTNWCPSECQMNQECFMSRNAGCLVSPRLHKWYNLLCRIWKLCSSYQIQPCTCPGHVFVSRSPGIQLQPDELAPHLPRVLSWTIIQLFWRQFIMNEMIVNLAGSNVDGNRDDLYCWHRLIRVTHVPGLCFPACGLGQS